MLSENVFFAFTKKIIKGLYKFFVNTLAIIRSAFYGSIVCLYNIVFIYVKGKMIVIVIN